MRYILLIITLGFTLLLQAQYNITIKDIYKNNNLSEQYPQFRFTGNGNSYTEFNDTAIIKYNSISGQKEQVLLSLNMLADSNIWSIDGYELSNDETKIVFYTNNHKIYRRSYIADYYVWDIHNKELYKVSDNQQHLATLSPDGNKVVYIYNNNIYIKYLKTGKSIQVTKDGCVNKIINGATDWVYEEEFGNTKAFEWSNDSKYLAYCRFDETDVPIFNMTIYQGLIPAKYKNKLYPENYTYKYPKAGENNSIVSVFIYNVETEKIVSVDVGEDTTQYIPRLKYSPNGSFVVYRLNRRQNKLEFLYANPKTGETAVFYQETNEKYIDESYFDKLEFINNGTQFIYTNETDGYSHIYLYSEKGKLIKQLTQGQYDITDYFGFDSVKNVIYYQSALPTPLQRSIYSCNIETLESEKINKKDGFNYIVFNKKYNFYINYYSTTRKPTVVTLYDCNNKKIRVVENNQILKRNIKLLNKEFFQFTTEDSVILNGWMIKPLNFSEKEKYPVLMVQYSGPNSQEVLDVFELGWEQVLASKGYVVVCVDPRGTGGRGEDFRKSTYLHLGRYETIDQILAAKYLGSLNYIDSSRIGIWGWSYGGFIALNCMTKGSYFFKVGIAVAPVTDWRYYDNIYTERFMRTPQENEKGYNESSPINYVDKLKGKLLIIHGTADDNVHLQNTLEFSEALVQADKQFDMFIYTNRNHSISGGNTRYHLFTKMLKFIEENL